MCSKKIIMPVRGSSPPLLNPVEAAGTDKVTHVHEMFLSVPLTHMWVLYKKYVYVKLHMQVTVHFMMVGIRKERSNYFIHSFKSII